jgi:N-acyl homoserine lactone hydrolase
MTAVTRLRLGSFLRPGSETPDGRVRAEAVLAYVVRHEDGLILFDTGIGSHPEVDAHYRPTRYSLVAALERAGVAPADISLLVNCHLHFDHCGGNPLFAGRPIAVQRRELATARSTEYTLPELVDFTGVLYEELDGEAEIRPGVWILPTPGHVDGHQSLAVRRTDGTIVLAGQAHDFASEFSHDVMARSAALDYRPWVDRVLEFDPRRVLFAHDAAVWEP